MLKNSGKRARLASLGLPVLLIPELHVLYGSAWEYIPDILEYSLLMLFFSPLEGKDARSRILRFSALALLICAVAAVPGLTRPSSWIIHLHTSAAITAALFGISLAGMAIWIHHHDDSPQGSVYMVGRQWILSLDGLTIIFLGVAAGLLSTLPQGRWLVLFPAFLLLALSVLLFIRAGSKSPFFPFRKMDRLLFVPDPPTSKNEGAEEYYRLIFKKCCTFMEVKKPYLVDSFSLSDLAAGVFTNKTYVSKAISRSSEVNFRRFVNHYRVKYAQDLFQQNMSLRVTELASLSGCKSVQTFCAVFKIFTGETPRKWCERMRKFRFRQ